MQNDLNLYVQFTKTNDEEQIVEGIATSEDLDSQGEIVKYDAIKAALPDYMKFGNIREMHTHSAVGKAIRAIPNDKKKNLLLTAKVVDPVAWQKVKAGVYNGFSIGGRVLKQVGNEIQGIMLNEISLVDRPANPAALFSLVKFDTSVKKDGATDPSVDSEGASEDENDGPSHVEVFRASYVLNIAADLCMLYDMYEQNGIDTSDVDKAIDLLKQIVSTEMGEDNDGDGTKQKLFATLDAFQKRKLTAEERKSLKNTDYAHVTKAGDKNLPLNSEDNIRTALTKFDGEQFESETVKRNAARKITAAAKSAGVEIDAQSSILKAAKQGEFEEVKTFVKSDAWMNDYFATAREILG